MDEAITACYRRVAALPDSPFLFALAIGRRHLAPGSVLPEIDRPRSADLADPVRAARRAGQAA